MDRLEQLVRNAKAVQSRLIATGSNIRTILFDTSLSIVSVENTTEIATQLARSGELREALLNWDQIRQIWASDQVSANFKFWNLIIMKQETISRLSFLSARYQEDYSALREVYASIFAHITCMFLLSLSANNGGKAVGTTKMILTVLFKGRQT